MPAPTKMSDLSTTAASNTPAGSEAIGTSLDDYLRAMQSVVRLEQANGTIASAATTDLSTVNEKSIAVTGAVSITSLGTVSAGITKQLRFAAALTLTHSASLYLIGAANILTAAEDVADFLSLGSGNWKMTGYSRALSVTSAGISDSTVAGRAILTAADAAAQRTSMGAQARSPAIQSVVSAATVTPTFSDDEVIVTAQAAALALANPTGTAIDGLGIVIRIKDNGTARAISYGTQYRALGVTLPTTTVISKTLYLGMIYNATDTKWDVVSTAQEL